MSASSDGLFKAIALLDAGQPKPALRLLHTHVASHPDDVEAHTRLAQAHLDLKEPAEARDAALRALALSPEREHPLRLLALASARLGDRSTAVRAAEDAQRIAPNSWLAHHVRVSVDVTANRFSHAGREAITPLLRLAPDLADSHAIAAGHILSAGILSASERELARKYVTTALEIDPQHTYAQYLLGNLEMRSPGRVSKGLRPTLDSVEGDPTDPANRAIVLAIVNASVRWLAWLFTLELLVDLFAYRSPAYPGIKIGGAITALACTTIYVALVKRNLGGRALTLLRAMPRVSRIFVVKAGLLVCSLATLLTAPFLSFDIVGYPLFFLPPLLYAFGILTMIDQFRGARTWGEQWREWIR